MVISGFVISWVCLSVNKMQMFASSFSRTITESTHDGSTCVQRLGEMLTHIYILGYLLETKNHIPIWIVQKVIQRLLSVKSNAVVGNGNGEGRSAYPGT